MWIDLHNIVETTGKMMNKACGTILFKLLTHTLSPPPNTIYMKIHVCTNIKGNDWKTHTTLMAVVATDEKARNKTEVQKYFSSSETVCSPYKQNNIENNC